MQEPEPAAKPKPGLDDLFGDKPGAKSAEPPAAKPAVPMDDLFGDKPPVRAPAEAPPPMEPAKPAPPLDDLFNDSPKPAAPKPEVKPAAPAADDIFGEPPVKKAPVQDLFDAAPAPAAPAAPAKPAPADPFGAVERQSAELLVMRRWQDNTGKFSVNGKLFEILDGKVRLLKDNGRTCTVPMYRLSPADADYVRLVIARLGTGSLGQLASQ
jgi:hypothetical protein